MDELKQCTGFQWDDGNADKNWVTHKVTQSECEQVFLNRPILVDQTPSRQHHEPRYYALGLTENNRRLFIVFTVREEKIRVISARDMSRQERRAYQSAQ